jgi:hypothetical protein
MKTRSINFLKIIFFLAIAIVINGCTLPALREIDYEAQLPFDANLILAKQFASDLAVEAGLKITYIVPQARPRHGDWSDVFLRRELDGNPRVDVVILTSEPENLFRIQISGDIESPEALAIAQKAKELFEKKHPGSKLTPFTRHAPPFGF